MLVPRIRLREYSIRCIVSGATVPNRSTKRLRATARIPRHTATLGASTPSAGTTGGRNGDPQRELDTGTTTMSSSSRPVSISSTETTTAGRCFPGPPPRPAPRATSHSSARCGSGNVVVGGVVPVAILVTHFDTARVSTGRIALGLEKSLMLGTRCQFGEQRSKGHPSLTGLGGEAVTSPDRNPDRRRRRCRHICSLLCTHNGTHCAIWTGPAYR